MFFNLPTSEMSVSWISLQYSVNNACLIWTGKREVVSLHPMQMRRLQFLVLLLHFFLAWEWEADRMRVIWVNGRIKQCTITFLVGAQL